MRWVLVLLGATCCLQAAGPTSGVLTGKILDPSGSAVVGADVKLTSSVTGTIFHETTDQDGRFAAENLPPGLYAVEAGSPGFVTALRKDVEVREEQRAVLDLVLTISPLSEIVTVTAKAPAAEGAFETRPHNMREILEIREVRESAAKDAGEAIANLEGVWRIRKGGIANDIVLRGFQQGNLNVLIDGVRVNGACPNHMDPSAFHVDFAEIDAVQVIKGPFDLRNQGGLAGTVNVATRKPSDGLHLTPNLSAGSFGYYNPSLHGSYSSAGGLHALGGYSYRQSGIHKDGSGRRATEYANYRSAELGHHAFDVATGWMKFGLSLPGNQNADLTYSGQRGGVTLYPYLLMDALYDDADRLSASWSIREVNGMVRRVLAEAYFTRVKHWMTDELRANSVGAPRGFSMATFASTKTVGGRLEFELPDTLVGFDGYRRDWNAVNTMRMFGMYTDQPSMPDVRMLVGGLYTQRRQAIGKLSLTAGARLDSASSEARSASLDTGLYWAYQGTRSRSAGSVNPSGMLWLTYALPGEVEMFGGVGSTVRVPDPQERYFALKRSGSDWVGNPNLGTTRNNEADFGLNVRRSRFSLRPTLFYSRLNNFVVLYSLRVQNKVAGVTNTAARSYEGIEARVHGGEVSFSVGFSRSILLSGGISYVRGAQYARPAAGIAGGNIAEMPPLKSRTSLRYGNRLFFAEFEGRASARQDRVDSSLREQATPGYALLGVRGGIHHRWLNVVAGVDNLLDRYYYEHLSFQRDPFRSGTRVPEPGRTLYVNLSLLFE